MPKNTVRKRNASRMIVPIALSAVVYVLLCLLAALGIQKEIVPPDAGSAASIAALVISTIPIAAAGKCWQERLLFGGIYAALFLIWRLSAAGDALPVSRAALESFICGLCPWLFSCIFHKTASHNTDRYRRKRTRL